MSWLILHTYVYILHMYFNIIYHLDTIPIHYHDGPGLYKAAGAAQGLCFIIIALSFWEQLHTLWWWAAKLVTFFREKLVEESRIV